MTQDQIIFTISNAFLLGIISTVFAIISGSVKKTLQNLEKGISENKMQIEFTKKEIADLKADLPLVYTLREDYIRVQQSQEKQINTLIEKVDKIAERIK